MWVLEGSGVNISVKSEKSSVMENQLFKMETTQLPKPEVHRSMETFYFTLLGVMYEVTSMKNIKVTYIDTVEKQHSLI